ncbi:MAG: hypothetical protein HQ523_03365 [Lentisphaerae bacterium]|nr:hypothetical protein [Lentisphaerota bacterium]
MKISMDTIRKLCGERGVSLSTMLNRAGVSRNAFYHLARKDSVLPDSVVRIARELGGSPLEFLNAEPSPQEEARQLIKECERIVAKHTDIDRDNVRHTLILLREDPIRRLRRALRRGRRSHIQ